MAGDGAHNRTRTDDLFLTKEVLCQLSYVGPEAAASGVPGVVGREGFEPPCLSDLVYSQASRRCSTDPFVTVPGRDCGLVVDPVPDLYALEPMTGLEPGTCGLQNRCSTN